MIKRYLYYKVIAIFLAVQLALPGLSYGATANNYGRLPAFKELSQDYSFPVLKGVKYNRENPLTLEFIVDGGNAGKVSSEETQKLIRYFLAGLTLPKNDLWVNLSPYEHDRIVPQALGETDLGYDMLKQDCLLKRLAASLTYPESESGRAYWNAINGVGANNHSPATNNFNKVWIVPGKAEIYENETTAFITDSNLKAMAEEDYLAVNLSLRGSVATKQSQSQIATPHNNSARNDATEAFKTHILPLIEKEVNNGRSFANLRQFYSALILALWFKEKFKNSLYRDFVDQNKITGIDLNDPQAKERVYNRYLAAFKDGVYNYVKRERVGANNYSPVQKISKRRYFSGGLNFADTAITRAPKKMSPIARLFGAVAFFGVMTTFGCATNTQASSPRTPAALAGGKTAASGKLTGKMFGSDYEQALEYVAGVQSIFSRIDYFGNERFILNNHMADTLVYLYQSGSLSFEDFPSIFWNDLRDNLGGLNGYGYFARPGPALEIIIQFARAVDKRPGPQAQRDKEFLRQILVKTGAIAQLHSDLLSRNEDKFLAAVNTACDLLGAGLISADQIPPATLGELIAMFHNKTPSLEALSIGPKPGTVTSYDALLLKDRSRQIGILLKSGAVVSKTGLAELKNTIHDQIVSRRDDLEGVGLKALADLLAHGGETFDLVPPEELDRLVKKHYCERVKLLNAEEIDTLGFLIDKKVVEFSRGQWRGKMMELFQKEKIFTEHPYAALARQGAIDRDSFPIDYFDDIYTIIRVELSPRAPKGGYSCGPLYYFEVLNVLLEANLVKDIPAGAVEQILVSSRGDDRELAPVAIELLGRLRAMNHPGVRALQDQNNALVSRLTTELGSGINPAMYDFYTQLWQRVGNDHGAMLEARGLAQNEMMRNLYSLCPPESRGAFFDAISKELRFGKVNTVIATIMKAASAILESADWERESSKRNLQAFPLAMRTTGLELLPKAQLMSILFINNLVEGDLPPQILMRIYDNPGFKAATANLNDMVCFDIARAIDSYGKRFLVPLDAENIGNLAKKFADILLRESNEVMLAPGGEVYALLHSDAMFDPVAVEKVFRPYIGSHGKWRYFKGGAQKNPGLDMVEGIRYNSAGVMLYVGAHGDPDHIWMDNGTLGHNIEGDLHDPRAISHEELAHRLGLAAQNNNGDLSFLTIVIDDCYSGNYSVTFEDKLNRELAHMLRAGQIGKLPRVIASQQRGLISWVNGMLTHLDMVRPTPASSSFLGSSLLRLQQFIDAEEHGFQVYRKAFLDSTQSADNRYYGSGGGDFVFFLRRDLEQMAAIFRSVHSKAIPLVGGKDELSNGVPFMLGREVLLIDYMGHDAKVTEVENMPDGKLKAKVKDLKAGRDGELLLTPHNSTGLVKDAVAVLNVGHLPGAVQTFLTGLLSQPADDFYTYVAKGVQDMYGLAFKDKEHDIKALHQSILDLPDDSPNGRSQRRGIAYFHESLHQLINQEKLAIKLRYEPDQNPYLDIFNDQGEKIGEVQLINPGAAELAGRKSADDPEYNHYLIRALQLQAFGAADVEFTDTIRGLSREPVAAPDASPTPTGGLDFSQDRFNLKVHSSVPDLPVSGGKGYDYLFIEDIQVKNISAERLQTFLQQP